MTIHENRSTSVMDNISIKGALLNYAPSSGYKIINANIAMKGSEMAIRNGSAKSIDFTNSTGSLESFNFTPTASDIGSVSLYSSTVNVRSNTFGVVGRDNAEPWALKIYGCKAGKKLLVTSNVFDGTNPDLYPVQIYKSELALATNRFGAMGLGGMRHGAIYHEASTIHLKQGALNSFIGFDDAPNQPSASLILANYGETDLYCGGNTLYRPNYWNPSFKFVKSINGVGAPIYDNWTHNYWGHALGSYDESEALPLVPSGVDLEFMLPVPPPPSFFGDPCTVQWTTSSQLLMTATEAELAEEWSFATDVYLEILNLYPASKESNEAALRLKAIALQKVVDSEEVIEIRASLQTAMTQAQVINPRLEALEKCVDLLIAGVHLDKASAMTELTSLELQASNAVDLDCIQLAKLELATYPQQGQISNRGGDLVAQSMAWQASVHDLMHFTSHAPGTVPSQEQPATPASFAILGSYPNPFNPTTTLLVEVPEAGEYDVALYNMLGQRALEVRNGELAIGRHEIQINGASLASGLYVARLEGPAGVRHHKIMLIK